MEHIQKGHAFGIEFAQNGVDDNTDLLLIAILTKKTAQVGDGAVYEIGIMQDRCTVLPDVGSQTDALDSQ